MSRRLGTAGCVCLRVLTAAGGRPVKFRPTAARHQLQQCRRLHVPTAARLRPAVSAAKLASVVPFKLSDIGEGIAEVQIKEWHVSPGSRVSQFDELCEVQSDKASVTITSRFDGVVRKLHYQVDDMAKVGSVLVDIEVDDGAADEQPEDSDGQSEQLAAPSPVESKAVPREKPASASEAKKPTPSSGGRARALATPAVRRIAMEHDIKLTDVRGTGKEGRVLKEDMLRHVGALPPVADADARSTDGDERPAAAAAIVRSFEPMKEDQLVPIRGYTRAMFKTMTTANAIPHFGYRDEVCVDRLVDLREQLKSMESEFGVKMSFMPLFIKAASMALHHFPVLNASIDDHEENIIYKASHNICVAIDTAGGLVVPNIKHCEQRNLWEIAGELIRLQAAARALYSVWDCPREMRLDKADLDLGTFTLSNVGSIGGTYAHPIIFPPQVAIGALGRIQTQARWDPGTEQFVPARIVKVSWCADHRVIDGATMARYSNAWKAYLENPATMIAEMR